MRLRGLSSRAIASGNTSVVMMYDPMGMIFFCSADDGKRRQIAIVVKEQMQLDGSLGAPELRPVKDRQGKVDDTGIQAHELVLKAELPLLIPAGDRRVAFCQELLEDCLIKAPGSVLVGISKRGFLGRVGNTEVLQLSLAAR